MASDIPPKDGPVGQKADQKPQSRSFAPDTGKKAGTAAANATRSAAPSQVPAKGRTGAFAGGGASPNKTGNATRPPVAQSSGERAQGQEKTGLFSNDIFKTKRLISNAPVTETIQKLLSIEKLDLLTEAKIKKASILLGISVVGAILLNIGFGMLDLNALHFLIVDIPVLAFFIFALTRYLRFKKFDLSNEFRTFLVPILRNLRNDLRKESTVNLNIDMDVLDARKYQTGKSAPYESGSRKKCVDTIYQRQLLKMALRFEDKNTLVVNCSEKLVKTSYRKSSGGKTKFKSKTKQDIDFDLRLLVNKEAYTVASPPANAEISLKAHPKGTMLCVKYKEKFKAANSQPNIELFLDKLVQLYTYLGPQRKAA